MRHTRHNGRTPCVETDCAACPVARRCWGDLALPLEGVRARRSMPLERGAVLLHQGERMGAVYIVVRGCLILREDLARGGQRVAGLRLPGELLGIESYSSGAYSSTAEAATETVVCRLLLPAAGSGHSSSSLLERILLKVAAQPERTAAPWAGLSALERVAAFIENYALRARVPRPTETAFILPMTRADIGSYLGLAPETVVRALGQLQGSGRLSIHGRAVRLAEPPLECAAPAA